MVEQLVEFRNDVDPLQWRYFNIKSGLQVLQHIAVAAARKRADQDTVKALVNKRLVILLVRGAYAFDAKCNSFSTHFFQFGGKNAGEESSCRRRGIN